MKHFHVSALQGAIWSITLLLYALPVSAVLLRARADEGAAAPVKNSAADVAEQVLAASDLGKGVAGSLLRGIAKSVETQANRARQNVTSSATPPMQTHLKVDVGFSDFEKNFTSEIDAAVRQIATSGNWTNKAQSELSKNISDSFTVSLQSALKPLKQNIAKTWMALPQDSQKDEYVSQLRASFVDIFADTLKSASSHLVNNEKQSRGLAQTEADMEKTLFVDLCHALPSGKKYCMKSVLNTMVHRLNDTLGLVSMTMRFDSGAMSLSQTHKVAPAVSKSTGGCTRAGACASAWNGTGPIGGDGNHQCSWMPMKPGWYLERGRAPDMCLREYPDAVTDHFKHHGYWHSCLDIASAWPTLPDGSKSGHFAERLSCGSQCDAEHGTKPGIYVDIGANIGTCVMQMLARLDVAQVVAFEPSPANLFYMTSSISKRVQQGDPRILKNLVLYPNPVGSERSMHTLYEQPGNAGNTGVNSTVMGQKMDGVKVETITLDEVFMGDGQLPPYIHLMKVDAQGYEVKILMGAQKLLASGAVNAMHIEVAPWWLAGQQASVVQYLSLLHENHFDLRPGTFSSYLSTTELTDLACNLDKNGTIMDMVALRSRTLEAVPRTPLKCPV